MAEYDAFISYARDPDEEFAPKLKEAMLKLGKRWNKRRALSVFLDNDALESSAGLRDSLQKALDRSRFLIILASPGSASSRWVGEEVEHWKQSGKSWEQIRLVLTEGTIVWDDAAGDFDFARSTAVGEGLRGVFPGEPLWCDMTGFSRADGLDIRSDGTWKNTVATLAAPVHPAVGEPPQPISKEDLVGADLVQFKRAKRLRRMAVIGLATLTVLATVAGIVAIIQRQTALAQARRAESRAMAGQALNNAETDRDLSALLALESVRVDDTSEARRQPARDPRVSEPVPGAHECAPRSTGASGRILPVGNSCRDG